MQTEPERRPERLKPAAFLFGDWRVAQASNSIQQGEVSRQLEPKAMDVLVALCSNAGNVLSAEELLERCWGSTLHGDNQVHKTITQLRKLLGDRAGTPTYIETIRKRGYRAIAAVTRDEQTTAWLAESPFRGLEAFEARHAAVFFGREADSRRLLDAVHAQAGSAHGLVIVLGPSGCGKTSLIQASLVPALERGADDRAGLSFTSLDLGLPAPGRLFVELGSAMLDWQDGEEPVFHGASADSLGKLLASAPASLTARLATRWPAPARRLGLFLDRFEALFALPSVSEDERSAMVHAIDVLAASPQVILVLACRNDFYPRIAEYEALMRGKPNGAHVDITRPDSSELARIIRLPAQAARLRFGVDQASGARLDDVLCQSVSGSPDALPLLQYTLQELYRQRSADGELAYAVFTHLGGVDGAIGRRAEEVIAALDPAQRAALPRVLALIVTVSATTDAVTSCSARWADLHDEDQRKLVSALVEARLLVSELVGSVAGFRVAHEALLRRWPRATEWIASHRNSLLIRARTAALAERWIGANRPVDLLLPPGQQLDEVRAMLVRGDLALGERGLALVQASHQRARSRARIRMTAMALILTLATLSAVLGVMAGAARNAAEQRRVDAEGLVQFMLGELVEKLRPLGRLDLLDGVSTRALAHLTRDHGGDTAPSGVLQRAKALQVIGEVRLARGDLRAAISAFSAAGRLLEPALSARPGDAELLKLLGTNAYWLGKIELDRSALPEARKYFLLYSVYADRLHALDPDNVATWIEQSYAYNNLGTLAYRTGDLDAANRAFTTSLDLKTRAQARRPEDRELSADIADSLSWLGELCLTDGRLKDALAYYERELSIITAMHAARPADSKLAEQRADALQHRALLLAAFGDDQSALHDYALADQLLARNLLLEPGNSEWQRALIYVQLEQLRIRTHSTLGEAELAALSGVEQRSAALAQRDPENDVWTKLVATARTRYALALLERSRHDAAGDLLALARTSLTAQLLRDPEDQSSTVTLAINHLAQARLLAARGEHDGERASCLAARDRLRSAAERGSSFKVLDPWVRALSCLGHSDLAAASMARLSAMGYRDAAYRQFLLHQR
ncbi:winged helix-turn-helix domain-containing protein [Rugamonas sp. CCM 8940]|uniref:nSTAND1 domain-containing NTPase n=1 Tax=Rugamonas sp. CCM 8940 TaxID=2765359 RepID=UPI0018F6CA6F|nr:winged helix-turn-helix domain-containing protein [Rugamonas sp. CCM 8940]MBJ7313510.1 winged helix-turn-helix domain-containing protein [Rugamonas sp. CCM 8940]